MVQYSTQIKYLGVIITNTLSWDKQTTATTKKLNSVLYQLKLCKNLLPQPLRQRLVTSLALPHVDYSCLVFTDITAVQNLRLYRAVNALIRFIFDIRKDCHITPYYGILKWLTVDTRRSYFLGCLVFKVLTSELPAFLRSYFICRSEVSSRITRASPDLFEMPSSRTEMHKRSFCCKAIKVWNDLPVHIRNSRNIGEFKTLFYNLLLERGSSKL